MPRFSAKVKEIFDTLSYHSDIAKANKLLEELKDPLDIAFGKLFITYHYLWFLLQGEYVEMLNEIENENKILKDQLLQFLINIYYCRLYVGMNVPVVSKEQAEKYLDHIEQSYQGIDYKDDWEEYYCYGRYYQTKASYEHNIKENLSNAIKFQKKGIEAWSKIPEEGEDFSSRGHNPLGAYYSQGGNFEEAEKSYKISLDAYKKYNNLGQLWPLNSLSVLNFIKGNLQKAKELNMQALDVAKRFNSTYGMYGSLRRKGSYLFSEGNYDEALKAYQESLAYRKKRGDLIRIHRGYFEIFDFYYQRFKITKDKTFLTQAEQAFIDLQELSKSLLDNKTVTNSTNYANSQILKHGNIRKKANALDILEELRENNPNRIEISLDLIELLFEDVVQSEDQDTINQIDGLMEKIAQIPLRNDPQAIFSFISQQIFLAKYNYLLRVIRV